MVLLLQQMVILEKIFDASKKINFYNRPIFHIKRVAKPSGPGALVDPRLERA